MKRFLGLLFFLMLPGALLAQLRYVKYPSGIAFLPNSIIKPVTTVKPDTILGQNQANSLTYQEESDHMLQPLDKTQISTGILYDRVFPLADLEDFTGTASTDTTDPGNFFQAYYELYNATYNRTGKITSTQFHNSVDAGYGLNYLPIGIMYSRYNAIDTNALANNLIYVQNGQAYDVPGRTTSPYLTKTVFIASPLYTKSLQYVGVGTTTLKLDPGFIFNTTGQAFTSYAVNFNDGRGDLPVSVGGTVTVTYSSAGKKYLTIIANTSAARLVCKAELNVVVTASSARTADVICTSAPGEMVINTALPFNASAYGDSETKAATGTAYLYFAKPNCSDRQLRKAVVFLDGFDPNNTRDHTEIYDDYLNNTTQKLADKFRNDGYDLVIFDFHDGGEYIERNGLLTIELLKKLRETYAATLQQDFVLVGPSMGALVGQYALAEAERRGLPHYTRLFISFDGAHQGANIPIGIQQAVGLVFQSKIVEPARDCLTGEVTPGQEEDAFALNARSAKQMLLHHYQSGVETVAPHPFRPIFVNTMNNLGYPKQCRKVAIVNGSRDGSNQSIITSSREILRLRVVKNLGGRRRSDLLRWKGFAAPQTGRAITFDAYTWKPVAKTLGIAKNYTAYTTATAGQPSLDVIAGGSSNTMEQFATAEIETQKVSLICSRGVRIPLGPNNSTAVTLFAFQIATKLKQGRNIKITTSTPSHCFIPTTSAVDLRVPGSPLVYNFANENLVCAGKTPFNAVYAPVYNQPHVQVTAENAAWFETEVKGPTPVLNCGESTLTVSINGPAWVGACERGEWLANVAGGNGTYSYEWYVNGVLNTTNNFYAHYNDNTFTEYFTLDLYVTSGSQRVQAISRSVIFEGCVVTSLYSVYPNPTSDVFQVTSTSEAAESFVVKLFNGQGKPVGEKKTKDKEKQLQFDVRHLPEGNYVMHITDATGTTRRHVRIKR